MVKLTELDIQNRPREKLSALGAEHISDAELLAIFLRTGLKGTNVITLAYQLLAHFGSLPNILNASQKEFCQVKGMGIAKYAQLQAALELSTRCLKSNLQQQSVLSNPTRVKQYCQQALSQNTEEVFAVLFLSNQHHLIAFEKLFFGTINAAPVYPRTIVKRALALNAASVIALHNHPSGSLQPSQADLNITQDIQKALKLVDIQLIDHIIVSSTGVLSMVELHLI